MRTQFIFLTFMIVLIIGTSWTTQHSLHAPHVVAEHVACDPQPVKGCVFKTIFEGEGVDTTFMMPIPQQVLQQLDRGLQWLVMAQHENGGFGAGTNSRQDIRDPHAVKADPATTAMVAMAILRTGSTLDQGVYREQLRGSTEFLLTSVEHSSEEAPNITDLTGTQIQVKLGAFIDVALASQFFSNLIDAIGSQHDMYARVFDAMGKCTRKIQRNQSGDGSTQGAGWAGVLQSSFSTNALEAAEVKGVPVDKDLLDRAREYQKKNMDASTGDIATDGAAGIMLYAVSGSSRASAKEARKARAAIEEAVAEGVVEDEAEVTIENLTKAGMSENEAVQTKAAFDVYNASKVRAQADEVISGFGNNGGEEFLSFLQTGEALIVNKDLEWQTWYNNTSDRLMKIQNADGSWSGHHCITSPVFCTATSLLILSVNNDIEMLVAQGG